MHAIVHAADIQDRDGGAALMATLFGAFPFLTRLFADGGYRGSQFQSAIGRTLARVMVEIVKRSDQAKAFVVLPKRARLPPPRLHPPHAAKTMQSHIMFPDRL